MEVMAPARMQVFVGGEWTRPLSPVATRDGQGLPTQTANTGLVLSWFRELNRLMLRQAGLHRSKKTAPHFGGFLPSAFNYIFFPSTCGCSGFFQVVVLLGFFFLAGMISHKPSCWFGSVLKSLFFWFQKFNLKGAPSC